MKSKKPTSVVNRDTDGKRENRLTCAMSDRELQILEQYLKKYRITNRGRWMRQTLLMAIYKEMLEDYPTLFDEHDMRR